MAIVSGGSGGGGPAAGTYVPVADPAGATLNTTTYDNNWTHVGKLKTLVFPQSTAAFAMAIVGDAFPRIISLGNPTDGVFWANGTEDPLATGAAWWIGGPDINGHYSQVIEAGAADQQQTIFGDFDTKAGYRTWFHDAGIAFQSDPATDPPITLTSGTNAPVIGGNVGDVFLRNNGPPHVYRCTVAGVAGAATWVAEVGNPIVSGALPTVAPVSGTAFQCSTTRDVFLLVPVTYNPGVATTATCKVELSPDNVTFSELITITQPVGTVFDGSIEPVSLVVPAAWRVKLTVTNATLGTGTYY